MNTAIDQREKLRSRVSTPELAGVKSCSAFDVPKRKYASRKCASQNFLARKYSSRRPGLAPLELVLWAPVLLFVTALLVNFGTAAAWRVRTEVAARDAADRSRAPRTGANEPRPTTLPEDDGTLADAESRIYAKHGPEQLNELDDPSIDFPVVRGPLPNGFEVYPTLDPDSRGLEQGTAEIDRRYAMLPRLGQFNSGYVRNHSLDDSWAISRMYFSGVIPIPNEHVFAQNGSWTFGAELNGRYHRFSSVPNLYRRTKLLYQFPILTGSLSARFVAAMDAIMNSPWRDELQVLDRDEDFIRYTGRGYDFYPRMRIPCELDRETTRELGLEGPVIDELNSRNEVVLGGVTRLPRRMTERFLSLYLTRIDQILADPTAAESPSELAELEAKVEQLKSFRRELERIEDQLRQNSTAR